MTSNSLLKRPNSQESLCDVAVLSKQPLKKLNFALNRIEKVVSLHLEFLQRHKYNIEKFQKSSDWNKLNEEHINASRTVQQLKADMYELELIGNQIVDEDLPKFEEKAEVIKNDILKEIAAFVGECEEAIQPCTALRSLSLSQSEEEGHYSGSQRKRSITPPCVAFPTSPDTEELFTQSTQLSFSEDSMQLQKSNTASSSTYRSWMALNKEILDLNGLLKRFADSVRSQRKDVDLIDTHMASTQENVNQGTDQLKKAVRYKLALLPVSGAVIGGLVGGPFGLVAGFKTGAALVVGGGILGFCGGRFIQKKKYAVLNNNNSVELEDMSNNKLRNSLSLSDLNT